MDNNQDSNLIEFPQRDSDIPALVPEGEYQLRLNNHSTARMFGSPRLILHFSIINFDKWNGVRLNRYYCVSSLRGKMGKKGHCKHKRTGDFTIEYFSLFPDQLADRLDRISLEPLYNSVIVGRVRTVKSNNQQKVLPAQLRHSVVAELLRIEK